MLTNNSQTPFQAVGKLLLVPLALLAMTWLFLGSSVGIVQANQNKVKICHVTGNASYHVIEVAEAALNAHLDHGDLIVGIDVDDNCEPLIVDSDSDGVADDIDNCVDVANPGQEDSYGSSAGDACEDTNGDGTPDVAELNFCVSIDGVLLLSQGTAVCESTATEGISSNIAIADGNYARAMATREMPVFGPRPSNNLYARAVGDFARAQAQAGEDLTAIAEGEQAFAVSHSGTNSSATATGKQSNAQVFFGDNNHASAIGEQVYANAGNGNNNTATATGVGSGASAQYGSNNTADSSGGEYAQAWFANDMSATSTASYTCTNENGEVAVDEDKCS